MINTIYGVKMKRTKLKNRALTKDRPKKVKELRTINTESKLHQCNPLNGGHEYQFCLKDNYGYCVNCGNEILV